MAREQNGITAAEIVWPCDDLAGTLGFLCDRLGFRLLTIFPADNPRVAVAEGHGLRLRLDRQARGKPVPLSILCTDPDALRERLGTAVAPNGAEIFLTPAVAPLEIPPVRQSFAVSRHSAADSWIAGRAGMQYRDLLPDRQGGRFIVSQIRIPTGGPVPDSPHFHRIRFQMIYCYKGWVRVAYEDQGAPMLLQPGDLFLQPPEIRHQVLECSDGMEVIEIGCERSLWQATWMPVGI